MSAAIRCRCAAFGTRPRDVSALSAMCCGLLVSVSTQVTVRVREDVFQREFRPGLAIELGRPVGQRLLLELVEVRAVHERPVDQHREPVVGGERQDRFSDSRSVIE